MYTVPRESRPPRIVYAPRRGPARARRNRSASGGARGHSWRTISSPINDHACLGPATEQIAGEVAAGNPAITDLESRFANTDDLAAWFYEPLIVQPATSWLLCTGWRRHGPSAMTERPGPRLRADEFIPT